MKLFGAALVAMALLALPARAETPVNIEDFLAKKLAGWQTRLQLEDWKIVVAPTRRADLKKDTLGGIQWDHKKKTAKIRVLHPEDYELPYPEVLRDLELTIVHELVHLELAALPRRESSRDTEEAAVVRLAAALLAAD